MDLLRAAVGWNNGSVKTADRFYQEALKRISEIKKSEIKTGFPKTLKEISSILLKKDINARAEDALMYNILCKNYATKFLRINTAGK